MRSITTLLVALMWSGVLASAAGDDATAPTLEAVPAEIDSNLSPDASVNVDVHLRAGAQDLRDITLTASSSDKIVVGLAASTLRVPELKAGSEMAWSLPLTHAGTLLGTAKLYLRVVFDVVDPKGSSRHRFLYTTVNVTPATASSAPPLVKADVIGGATSISHERPAQLLLQLTNPSQRELRVTNALVYTPAFICVTRVGDRCDPQAHDKADGSRTIDLGALALPPLAPGHTLIVPLLVQASSQVVPGTYTVLLGARVASGGLEETATATHELDVVVLGESELLKLVGVPSLLFLPGALLLITLALCLSIGLSADERKTQRLQPTETSFWVLSIGLSLLAAFGYPSATRWLGHERNYLAAYGLEDYMYVFGAAIAGGVIAYIAYRGWKWLGGRIHEATIRRQVPQPNDPPLVILDKLARLNENAVCRQVYPTGGNAADALLVLGPWSTDTELWLVPPARITLTVAPGGPDYYEALDAADRLTDGEVVNAAELAEEIRLHAGSRGQPGWWEIAWQTNPGATQQPPFKGKTSAWTYLPRPARLLVS